MVNLEYVFTKNAVLSLAPLKYQMMAAIWAQTPTTRAPARHVQYQDRTSVSEYLIHNKYFFDDALVV
jgi:hypothetical protein